MTSIEARSRIEAILNNPKRERMEERKRERESEREKERQKEKERAKSGRRL